MGSSSGASSIVVSAWTGRARELTPCQTQDANLIQSHAQLLSNATLSLPEFAYRVYWLAR